MLRRNRSEAGEGKVQTLLIILGIAGVVYLGIAYVPILLDHLEFKSALREGANMGWKEPNDDAIKRLVYKRAGDIGSHMEENDDGEMVEKTGLVLEDDAVEVERNEPAKKITVKATYTRTVYFPFLKGKTRTITFHPSTTESLEGVKW